MIRMLKQINLEICKFNVQHTVEAAFFNLIASRLQLPSPEPANSLMMPGPSHDDAKIMTRVILQTLPFSNCVTILHPNI